MKLFRLSEILTAILLMNWGHTADQAYAQEPSPLDTNSSVTNSSVTNPSVMETKTESSVKLVGHQHYQIPFDWFKREIMDPYQLAKAGRLVPISENSKVIGFRLFGIRKGSSLDLLGLKNGDLILSISGQVLSDTEQLKKIYDWAIEQTKIQIQVKRQEQVMGFLIEILR